MKYLSIVVVCLFAGFTFGILSRPNTHIEVRPIEVPKIVVVQAPAPIPSPAPVPKPVVQPKPKVKPKYVVKKPVVKAPTVTVSDTLNSVQSP